MPNCYKKLFCCATFDFHGFQKGTLWTTFSPSVQKTKYPRFPPDRCLPRPCFSRNNNNVGPSVFLTVICSMKICFVFFILFCFSLCYALYVIFITFVDNTTVNAQPSRPHIFEKVAPHFKKTFFII